MPRRLKSEGIDALVGADIQAILARYQGLDKSISLQFPNAGGRKPRKLIPSP
jgi:hypothetical protein